MTSDTDQSTRSSRGCVIALLIAAIFIVPIVIAWLYAFGILDWRGQGMVNQGLLLDPPLELSLSDPEREDTWTYPGNWRVVLVSEAECAADCQALAARIATVYQLLGQRQTRVDLVHVNQSGGAAQSPPLFFDQSLDAPAIEELAGEVRRQHGLVAPFAGLLDWRGYLMMVYPADAEEGGILEDLKRVLRATESG
ncbi:MAG: hypothetical protein KJO38_07400 [Gammaproteobacteria bacterium]|nr:hypothetical protein [Gammaproteobacteria bacterium]